MKQKILNFIRRLPLKIYLALAALVLFTFFANSFGQVDIQKTAIVVAVGIDRENDEFSMTAQIALPSGQKSASGIQAVEAHGSGKTVSECVSELYAHTGRVPKFIFCDLVLLGEEAAKADTIACLDFFLRSEYLPDSCQLATCKGRAEEMLTAQSATDEYSSAAISKLFSDAAVRAGRVCPATLKEFAIGYYGASKSGYMPYLIADEQDAPSAGSESAQNGEGGGESGEGEQSAPKKKLFSAEQTALFSSGKMTTVITEEESFVLNLLQSKVFAGSVTVDTDEGAQSLTILKNDGGASLNMSPSPTAKLSISLRVDLNNRATPSGIDEISKSVPKDEVLKNTENKLRDLTASLWERSRAGGCDLFYLKRELFRASKEEYEAWKDSLLERVLLDVTVTVQSAR